MTALPRYLYAVPPMAIALSLFVWQLLAQFDWLEIAFGPWAWLYWVAALLWAGSATLAVRRVKWGTLVMLAAPAALFPRNRRRHALCGTHVRKLSLVFGRDHPSQSSTVHPFTAASLRSGPWALTANGSSAHSSTGASETWSL